jgi:hypothetical protein
MTPPLPDTSTEVYRLAGVWTRLWEEDPLGSGVLDRDTFVQWTQSPSGIYVDLRLPNNAPGLSLESATAAGYTPNPAGLSTSAAAAAAAIAFILQDDQESTTKGQQQQQQRHVLLSQKSFAGRLTMAWGATTIRSHNNNSNDDDDDDNNNVSHKTLEMLQTIDPHLGLLWSQSQDAAAIPLCTCYWKRQIDYRPPSGGLDVGICISTTNKMEDDGSVEIRETGEDGSYAEGWYRLPGTASGPFMALELCTDQGVSRNGYWVRAGNRFAYAIGRPNTEESCRTLNCEPGSSLLSSQIGRSLDDVISDNHDNNVDPIRQVLSYVAVVGTIQEDDGSWLIESSSRPDLVGCTLIDKNPGPFTCSILTHKETVGNDMYVTQVSKNTETNSTWHRVWKVCEIQGFELPMN